MKDPLGVGCTGSSTSSSVDEKGYFHERFPILCVKPHPFGGACCQAHTDTLCLHLPKGMALDILDEERL